MNENRREPDIDSPEYIVKELRATFREEAYEMLVELENSLLELEKNPADKEQIGRVFRVMHTIKGSAGACEFHEIVAFTHELETIFDKIRSGKVNATHEIINLTLQARDQIKAMLNAYYLGGSMDEARAASILVLFKELLAKTPESMTGEAAASKAGKTREEPQSTKTYRIRFRPNSEVLVQGTNPINLLNELRELGMCKVVAQTEAIPCLKDYKLQANYTHWDVILTTNRGINAIRDVFIFIKDAAEVKIEVIDEEGSLDNEISYKNLGEILVERGDLTSEDVQKVLKGKKRIGELLVETGIVPNTKVESALVEQQHVRDMREQRLGADAISSIRVATGKLDTLVNLVGELVTVQARLTQSALNRGMPEFLSIAEEVERLTASLRDNTMNIRMLPIGTTFSKFKRLVRDLSFELGKEIDLTTDGAETELDKTVIERLGDPLVHLIRNSIDHGIESPEARVAAGKPRQGTIHLAAVHSGANVLIRIADDGAGINAEAVRLKAIEKEIIPADAAIPERDLLALLFEPGFSMAQKVTNVSGRGVGMDVVKKTIDALSGSIEVNSTRGRGTTMIIKLPLTLAIIDGFLIRVAAEHYILPLALVEECVELNSAMRAAANGRHVINVRGHVVPYMRLREQFQIGGEPPAIEQIVIAIVNDQRIGFTVDAVIGGHQTVIKNLGRFYQNVKGISGATILGDGTVALILDAQALVSGLERHGMRALNCWEFKKCGREQGGAKSKELGVCSAYPHQGRHCAQVVGTLCGGEVQGTFAKKLYACSQCDFYTSGNYG